MSIRDRSQDFSPHPPPPVDPVDPVDPGEEVLEESATDMAPRQIDKQSAFYEALEQLKGVLEAAPLAFGQDPQEPNPIAPPNPVAPSKSGLTLAVGPLPDLSAPSPPVDDAAKLAFFEEAIADLEAFLEQNPDSDRPISS